MEIMGEKWDCIKEMIEENEINNIVQICKTMDESEFRAVKNKLIQELRSTDLKHHRNTIAIVLSDLKCDEAIGTLIDLINAPENRNCRGTFIYALQELKCEDVLDKIIPILFDGNLEVKFNMYDLLSKKVKYMSETTRWECMNILREEKKKLEDELELLEDVEQNIFKVVSVR